MLYYTHVFIPFSSLGLHASRYVTYHGMAINCNVDLSWFSHIVPCGIPDKEATSLSKELNRNVTVQETIPIFLDAFQKYFPCEYVFDSWCKLCSFYKKNVLTVFMWLIGTLKDTFNNHLIKTWMQAERNPGRGKIF